MIGTASHFIKDVDEFLTLEGLRIIWDRNRSSFIRHEAAPKAIKPPARLSDPEAKAWPTPKKTK